MMRFKLFAIFLFLGTISFSGSAQEKKTLTPEDLPGWKSMKNPRISNDGKWVSYEVAPYVGDGTLYLKNPDQGKEKEFARAKNARFSPQNNYIVFMVSPPLDSLRKWKIDKVPEDKRAPDTLAVYVFETDSLIKFADVKSFDVASEGADWLVFQYTKPKKNGTKKVTVPAKKEKKKQKVSTPQQPKTAAKKPIKRKTSPLVIFHPTEGTKKSVAHVSEYTLSKYGNSVGYICSFGDTIDSTGVYWFQTELQTVDTSYFGLGNAKKPTFSRDGMEYVWIHSADTGTAKAYSLFSTRGNQGTRIIVDTNNRFLPEGHTVSENGRLYFSEDGSKIFFGTAPRPKELPKDSIPPDEKAQLDVWNWNDLLIQPQQLKQKEQDEKKTFLAVFTIANQRVVSIQNDSTSRVNPLQKGNSEYALVTETKNYDLASSCDYPSPRHYYRVNVITGEKILIAKEVRYNTSMSPSGKYFVYYDADGEQWMCVAIDDKSEIILTQTMKEKGQILADYDQEVPAKPFAFGIAGWAENDEWVLIETKYDIWKVDPQGEKASEPLSFGYADANGVQLRFKNFDFEREYIKLDSSMIFQGRNLDENTEGLFWRSGLITDFRPLVWENEAIYDIKRARETNRFIYRPMSFSKYPDIMYCGGEIKPLELLFDTRIQISDVVPEQKEYNWGFVKKHYWKDSSGEAQKGLLYYPENFDMNKKYPVMIYFYEKNFETENHYKSFRPSASTISIPLYTGNGYLVFVPDIHYTTGNPGNDAVNAVVSGAKSLIEFSYVDESKMAIQGQSWGGYQVAYIVTQTNMFAAAMAGAPVSNMTSAYGGIRWESGRSREFQYEKTQSRIGATLWEKPDLYIQNSPLFYLPKVETPLLIMHNDKDGAVPYYQGIELFMGLRRLQKPAWLLVYNNEAHNLMKTPNRIDLSTRMFQFFNHYLKGEPVPKWMVSGIPAVDKGEDFGLEFEEKSK